MFDELNTMIMNKINSLELIDALTKLEIMIEDKRSNK